MMSEPTPNATSSSVQDTVTTPRVKLYFPGQKYLVYCGGFYVFLLLLLTIPYIQRK